MNVRANIIHYIKSWIFFLAFVCIQHVGYAAEPEKETLECLACPELTDPTQYAKGAMKFMRQIVPGKNRWLFRSEVDFSHDFGLPAAVQPDFARLMATFKARGTHIVFALQPTRGLMHRDKIYPDRSHDFNFTKARANFKTYAAQLRAGGAIVPDITPLIDHPPNQEYFYRRDHHWTPAGARATAELVVEEIRHLPVYQTLTTRKYKTAPGVMVSRGGSMNMAMRQICDASYSMQHIRGDQTVPVDDDASILFEDLPDPEVVLVGTSNSAAREEPNKQLNFDGYLKEYLETDILNYALPGSGYDGSLIEYLQSPDYHINKPPKIIIWEMPVNYQLENPLTYRQLIPAINGGCHDEPLLKNKINLPRLQIGQRIELLSNMGANSLALNGLQGLLRMHISDKSIRSFYIIIYYDNGNRDKVWFRREGIVSGGLYYLELNRSDEFKSSNIISVFMEPTQESNEQISIEAALCH
jgi:hypothetical protein